MGGWWGGCCQNRPQATFTPTRYLTPARRALRPHGPYNAIQSYSTAIHRPPFPCRHTTIIPYPYRPHAIPMPTPPHNHHLPPNRRTTHCPNPIIQPSPNIVNTREAAKQETIKTNLLFVPTKRLLPAIKTGTTLPQERGKSRLLKPGPASSNNFTSRRLTMLAGVPRFKR